LPYAILWPEENMQRRYHTEANKSYFRC